MILHLAVLDRAVLGIAAFTGIVMMTQSICSADFTFLGPTPYLSAADSPFPVDGSNPEFYLEDFEDGLLNTPGIFQPLLPITHATVIGPNEFTDSVDADDGIIDGSGNSAHSLAANAYTVFPTDPPRSWSDIRFGFDKSTLGYLPNAFGFVWSDGIAPNEIAFELFDEQFQLLARNDFHGLGDPFLSGQTAEDRFLGVVSTAPFTYVQIISKYSGFPYTFEVDHVQYGVIPVCEPRPMILVFTIVIATSRGFIVRIRN
jgi:hypothetical protein